LTDIQIILINMQTTLTPLLICKLFRSHTSWRQNKYGGRARLFKPNLSIAML